MKLALATLLAVAVCAATALPADFNGRIIGGVNALPGEFPQICLIQWVFLTQTSNVCACAVLNNNHVVTAAHCITEAPTSGRLEVLGGVLDHTVIAPQRQRLGVLQTFIHPEFNAGGAEAGPRRNDIAIVSEESVSVGGFTSLTSSSLSPTAPPAVSLRLQRLDPALRPARCRSHP